VRHVMPYLLVGIGGFFGANARFLLASWTARTFDTRFPLGTFLVNVSGCLVIGILGTVVVERLIGRPDHVQFLLVIGFLGAYTTFSSFAFENNSLIVGGHWLIAALYITLSVFVGLLAARAGVVLARTWF